MILNWFSPPTTRILLFRSIPCKSPIASFNWCPMGLRVFIECCAMVLSFPPLNNTSSSFDKIRQSIAALCLYSKVETFPDWNSSLAIVFLSIVYIRSMFVN